MRLRFRPEQPLESLRSAYGPEHWPPREVADYWDKLATYNAFLRGDEIDAQGLVRGMASAKGMDCANDEDYLIIPLALRLARASSNMLYGEEPVIEPSAATDKARVEEVIKRNRLYQTMRAAAVTSASEGCVYIKVSVDRSTPRGRKVPIIEAIGPRRVIPTFKGDQLLSAKVLLREIQMGEQHGQRVLRVLECHTAERIDYEVWEGTGTTIGRDVGLAAYPEHTGDLKDGSNPAGELLIVHIPNAIMTDHPHGRSDLDGLLDFLLALNEIFTLTQQTYRASPPIHFLPESLFDEQGNVPSGVKAVPMTDDMVEFGSGKTRVEMIQPQFNSSGFKGYVDEVMDLIQLCSGFSDHALGRHNSDNNTHVSAASVKVRMVSNLAESAGKSSFQQEGYEQTLRLVAKLDAWAGFHTWSNADDPVTVDLQDGIPEDPEVTIHILSALSDVLAPEDRIRMLMPHLDESEIKALIARGEAHAQAEQQKMIDQLKLQSSLTGPPDPAKAPTPPIKPKQGA